MPPSALRLTGSAWKPFDDCLIAVDEFHHVSANSDNKLGTHLSQFIARDKVHIIAMTGSYFRGDAEAVLSPQDEARFESGDLYLLRTAKRLSVLEAAGYRILLLHRLVY
jgi:hypothetical protein